MRIRIKIKIKSVGVRVEFSYPFLLLPFSFFIHLFTLFVLQAVPLQAYHDKNLASYSGVLDRMGAGIAELGMGNTGTARLKATPAAYWNPALLAFTRYTTLSAGEDIRSLNRNGGYANIQGRVAPRLGLGLGAVNRGDYKVDVLDKDENFLGTARPQDIAIYLGAGFKLSRKGGIGLATQWYQANRDIGSSIGDINLIGILNVGWFYTWTRKLHTAVVLRNLGLNKDLSANYDFNSLPGDDPEALTPIGEDFFPKTFVAAVRYQFEVYKRPLDVYGEFLDFQLEDIFFDIDGDHHAMGFRLGADYQWHENLNFRTGYDRGNLSVGLGYRWRVYRKRYLEIDYALLIERKTFGFNPFGLGLKYRL